VKTNNQSFHYLILLKF